MVWVCHLSSCVIRAETNGFCFEHYAEVHEVTHLELLFRLPQEHSDSYMESP